MDNRQQRTEFEAKVAAEAVAPAEFFAELSRLQAEEGLSREEAEALRLIYLANPLNRGPDKDLVRSAPLPPPRPPASVPDAAGSPATSPPRQPSRASAPAAPPAVERAALLDAAPPAEETEPALETDAAAEEAAAAWQAAQAAFQRAQWDEARRLAQSVAHLPAYEDQVRTFLRTLDHHEDFVLPQLHGLAAGITSARRREAWDDVDQIWARAQAIIEAEQRQGVPARLPPVLVEQYTRAKNAQEAQPLVQQAIQLRRGGQFVEADSLLAEAIMLDPDNAVILAERERCSLGLAKLGAVRPLTSRTSLSVSELAAALEDTAALEQLAPESQEVQALAGRFRALREDTADRLQLKAQQLLDETDLRPSLSERWSLCGEAGRFLDDLHHLTPERPELARLEERLERLSAQLSRAQELLQGLASAMDAFQADAPVDQAGPGRDLSAEPADFIPPAPEEATAQPFITPIQAGRLASDLVEAQSIVPDDLSLRAIGGRLAEAIAASLSSSEHLLRDPEQFDLATFYAIKDLIRLLADCPGGPGPQILAGYRHALVAKGAQAVVTRLERGLAEPQATAALTPIEEALQLASALQSVMGRESAQAAAELTDRIISQVRRWIYLRLLACHRPEELEQTVSDVADMLSHLRTVPGTPQDAHADLERELLTSTHQAVDRLVSREALQGLPWPQALARLSLVQEFVDYALPSLLERFGHADRARSAALAEVLDHARQQLEGRRRRAAVLRIALPAATAAAALALIVTGVWLAGTPSRQPGQSSPPTDLRIFGPEPNLAGVPGHDCDYVDGHNVCNIPSGPQFKTEYRKPDVRDRLGSPLSGPMREATDVQYFQYGRLEYHPENPAAARYSFGLIGVAVSNQRAANDGALRTALEPVMEDPARGRYFAETGHHVSDRHGFLTFFTNNGGVAAFGNPISEEYETMDGQVAQYFETARLEGRRGEPTSARLGNLGIEYLREVLGARVCHRLLGNETSC